MESEVRRPSMFLSIAPEIWVFPLVSPLPVAGLWGIILGPISLLFNDTGVPLGKLLGDTTLNILELAYKSAGFSAVACGLLFYAMRKSKLSLPIRFIMTAITSIMSAKYTYSNAKWLGLPDFGGDILSLSMFLVVIGTLAAASLTSAVLDFRSRSV